MVRDNILRLKILSNQSVKDRFKTFGAGVKSDRGKFKGLKGVHHFVNRT